MKQSIICCGLLLASLLCDTTLAAGQAPAGSPGIDWASKKIKLTDGVAVKITARVTTQNAQSGNKSSVVLFVNDIERAKRGVDAASTSVTYTLSGNGSYELLAKCSNERADAETCTISVELDSEEVFGKK